MESWIVQGGWKLHNDQLEALLSSVSKFKFQIENAIILLFLYTLCKNLS